MPRPVQPHIPSAPTAWPDARVAPDGTLYRFSHAGNLMIIAADGRTMHHASDAEFAHLGIAPFWRDGPGGPPLSASARKEARATVAKIRAEDATFGAGLTDDEIDEIGWQAFADAEDEDGDDE